VLNHPDGACGYRIDHEGCSLAYVTDTEHVPGAPDRNILELIDGADLVIYDTTYTEREFACKAGWGHSTWVEGIKLCRMAGARRLALFHHEPDHDDADMEAIEAEAQSVWSPVFAAREGETIVLR
jgi:phosphoribosyl 1,2-cyclic phosphodiesterase